MRKDFIELTLIDGNKTYIRKDFIWRVEKTEKSSWVCSIAKGNSSINVKEPVEKILKKLND